jgi:hypothetical protein
LIVLYVRACFEDPRLMRTLDQMSKQAAYETIVCSFNIVLPFFLFLTLQANTPSNLNETFAVIIFKFEVRQGLVLLSSLPLHHCLGTQSALGTTLVYVIMSSHSFHTPQHPINLLSFSFLWIHLPLDSSSSGFIFLWIHLPLDSSSSGFIFLWIHLPLDSSLHTLPLNHNPILNLTYS